VFDCHACHHPMSDVRWRPRAGASPGRIRLNDANFLMLRQIARRALAAPAADAFEQRLAQLHRAIAGDGGDPREAARAMHATLEELVRTLARTRFQPADLGAMLAGLVDDGLAGQYRDYAGAEQATMAIGSLLAYLARNGGVREPKAANAALDRMHAAVRDDEKYRAETFEAALAGLRRVLEHR